MSHAPASTPPASSPARPLSLGVIFLTLYIDLIGFSIIFPLGPDLLDYYLRVDGQAGILGWLLGHLSALAQQLGQDNGFTIVLFGGVISSVFSILQFIFAPFWGALSDRLGRRRVLRFTVAGTALGYLVWICSGSFWLFLLSRLVTGAFSGNLSVATAAVADVTSRGERAKAMGLVGAAFGLGLVTGPALGAFTAQVDLLAHFPALAAWGINPFSVPAVIAFALCLVNLVWISLRFPETLTPEARAAARAPRLRNPIRAILALENTAVRRTNGIAFVFSIAFVAMETSLTFLAAQRFGYSARENGLLLAFLGACTIVTQGYIVRRLFNYLSETRVLTLGLGTAAIGLLLLSEAAQTWQLYLGVAALAVGSSFVNPATTGLISLYSSAEEQGRVLGIFRSLGALSRAITPVCAGMIYWMAGAATLYVISALLAVIAGWLSLRLPQPTK